MNSPNSIPPFIRFLLICGAVACPLFLLVVAIEGALRPGYHALLYPLSSLAIGGTGWTQVINFIVTGFLILLFSRGLKRVLPAAPKFRGPLLLGLVGFGLMGAGFFVTDPVYGYPADRPLVLAQYSWHGHLHDGFSMFVFVCLPWACFVFRRYFRAQGSRGWALYSAITGFAMIAVFILTSMGFKQLPGFVLVAGLLQRLCIAIGWTWISLLSIRFFRQAAFPARDGAKHG